MKRFKITEDKGGEMQKLIGLLTDLLFLQSKVDTQKKKDIRHYST